MSLFFCGSFAATQQAYYPGELGGDAIAAVLLGDVSPAGRTTTTIYDQALVTQRNITDMEMRPHKSPAGGQVPGITHRFYGGTPLFPFGWGLSYTSFGFKWAGAGAGTGAWQVSTANVVAALPAFYRRQPQPSMPAFGVAVTNSGSTRTSDVVVLCFVSSADPEAPRRQLAGFERVKALKPGQTVTVNIVPAPTSLTWVSTDGNTESVRADTFTVRCGGEPDGFVAGTLTVAGPPEPVFRWPDGNGNSAMH